MKTICMLAVGLTVALGLASQAQAAVAIHLPDEPDANFIQVFEGCGPFGHRGPFGHCRPGGQAGGYIVGRSCPPGFHIGRYGRRCWPNRY